MRRLFATVAICGTLAIAGAGFVAGQDAPATPGATPELCASPEISPVASGEATPNVITSGSPEAVATSVVENIETGLDVTACATPAATPAA